jgi:hypothetical protein
VHWKPKSRDIVFAAPEPNAPAAAG